MDMAEALNGIAGDVSTIKDFGYFGVIGAEFDDNARATGGYFAKPSYYALQTICSVLAEEYEKCDMEIENVDVYSVRIQYETFDFTKTHHYVFERKDGTKALFYWKPTDLITETYDGETSFSFKIDDPKNKIQLVDMLDGSIYDLEGRYEIKDGKYVFTKIPLTDAPLLITIGDFIK